MTGKHPDSASYRFEDGIVYRSVTIREYVLAQFEQQGEPNHQRGHHQHLATIPEAKGDAECEKRHDTFEVGRVSGIRPDTDRANGYK